MPFFPASSSVTQKQSPLPALLVLPGSGNVLLCLLADADNVLDLRNVVVHEVPHTLLQRGVGLSTSSTRALHLEVQGAIRRVEAVELDISTILLNVGPDALLQQFDDPRLNAALLKALGPDSLHIACSERQLARLEE